MPADKSYIGFILDEHAKFHDGSPVTADDAIFSYNALMEKASRCIKFIMQMDRVEKVNSREARFYFKKERITGSCCADFVTDENLLGEKTGKGEISASRSCAFGRGSGPYKLEKFEPGRFLIFKRDKNYWAKDLPSRKRLFFFNFDEVRFDYYQDTTVTLQALFAGSIDVREEYIAKIWVTGYDKPFGKQRQNY